MAQLWFVLASVSCVADTGEANERQLDLAAGETDRHDGGEGDVDCVPTRHGVSNDVAVFGCAAQVAAVVGAGGTLPPVADAAGLAAPSNPSHATTGRRLKNCTWSSFTDGAKTMLAMCPAETHVVSGGCFATSRIISSAPFEDNTVGDLPDQGERYQDVTPATGWLCTYEGLTQTEAMKAAAFCCD